MPRLTNNDYLTRHHSLAKLWQLAPLRFSLLSYHDQLLLHEYFQTQDDLSNAELLQRRAELTACKPSLPQSAGRALARLLATERPPKPASKISVLSTARPKPDIERLARAFLELTHQHVESGAPLPPSTRSHRDSGSDELAPDGVL